MVNGPPLLSTCSPGKAATPLTAEIVVLPPRTAPAPFGDSVTVTLPVKLGVKLPSESRAWTCTMGAIATPATTSVGCALNASCCGGAAEIVNPPLVAVVSEPDDAVSA